MNKTFGLLSIVCSLSLFSGESSENSLLAEDLDRKDSMPVYYSDNVDDSYLEGYIQALLNAHYYELAVRVEVQDHVVYLYNMPTNRLISNSIISFVSDIPSVEKVEVAKGKPAEVVEAREDKEVAQINGIWFPQSTMLYQPMIADPYETMYSAAYRWGDNIIGSQVVAVSFGDYFPIFRWTNIGSNGADLQLDIQAGVWSDFKMWVKNHGDETSELFNTDYLVGIPISYAFDNWSFRFRGYHISSHLGDEFMKYNPEVERVNPSYEALDFFTSYQLAKSFRIYGGVGVVVHSDNSYHMKPLYVQYGGEVRLLGRKSYYHKLYGTPFFAINLRNWQAVGWDLDGSYLLGYEWSKLQGVGRKVRIFAEYHNGYGVGQFFKDHTSWFELRLAYGF